MSTRHLLLGAAVAVCTALPALADDYSLTGRYSDQRTTAVELQIDTDRVSRSADTESPWTSSKVRRLGKRRLLVTYEVASPPQQAGLVGAMDGQQQQAERRPEKLHALYTISKDGEEISETVWRYRFSGWRWIRTRGVRANGIDEELRAALAKYDVTPLTRPAPEDPALVDLGRDLFFDKILSGNKTISCATCHHPSLGSSDSLSLPLGQGAHGLGPDRLLGSGNVIPRNAPDVFNDGLLGVDALMWDSRIARDPLTGALTTPEPAINGMQPAHPEIASALPSVLAAQAMFPVTSGDEMRGQAGQNEIADAANNLEVWERLMARLNAIPEYSDKFAAAFGQQSTELNFGHAARAIAAFERESWTAVESPFDQYLRGDARALTFEEKQGAMLFFGAANCAECHSGPQLSDFEAASLSVPQLGPGKEESTDDRGLSLISGNPADDYKFRTPALRNVAATGPYFHDGAYTTLRGAVMHHLDPAAALQDYDPSQLREDFRPLVDEDATRAAARMASLDPRLQNLPRFSAEEVDQIVAFLESLTDPSTLSVPVPSRVPSGLPVADLVPRDGLRDGIAVGGRRARGLPPR